MIPDLFLCYNVFHLFLVCDHPESHKCILFGHSQYYVVEISSHNICWEIHQFYKYDVRTT